MTEICESYYRIYKNTMTPRRGGYLPPNRLRRPGWPPWVIEWLLQQYAEHGEVADVEDDSEDEESEDLTFDDLSEEEKNAVELVVSDLYEQEPQGTETADEWQYVAQEAQESGDTPYAVVAAVTAAFHQGKMTSEE